MNWVDIALIVTLSAGGLIGIWIGLIRTYMSIIGIIAGIVSIALLRGTVESWLFGFSVNHDLVTLLSYLFVITPTIAITWIMSGITRKLVYGMSIGWADRIGGMAAGLAVGAVVVTGLILGMARFSDNRSPDKGAPGKIFNHSHIGTNDVDDLRVKFVGSPVASFLLSAAGLIPDKARNLAPVGWLDALEDLEDRLEGIETARR